MGKEREKERMKPHLDFFGAPVMIGLSIVALGKTTSYVSILCTSLQYSEKSNNDDVDVSTRISFVSLTHAARKSLEKQRSNAHLIKMNT